VLVGAEDAESSDPRSPPIERLRVHLGVDRCLVWGGSWGVTLALAYAQRGRGRICRVSRSSYRPDWKEPGMDLGGLADKAKNALDSEQGEQHSDQALDKAEQLADEKTGGKYDQQIDKGRDLADQRIGQQDPDPSGT
jgi:pimeloyl-ACP methyl ester carboxylesterase